MYVFAAFCLRGCSLCVFMSGVVVCVCFVCAMCTHNYKFACLCFCVCVCSVVWLDVLLVGVCLCCAVVVCLRFTYMYVLMCCLFAGLFLCAVYSGVVYVLYLMGCSCVFLLWYMYIYRYVCLCVWCLAVFFSMCCVCVFVRFPGVVGVRHYTYMNVCWGVVVRLFLIATVAVVRSVFSCGVFLLGCLFCVVLVASLLRVCAFVVFHICVGLRGFFFCAVSLYVFAILV